MEIFDNLSKKVHHLITLGKSWILRMCGYLPVFWSKAIDNFGDDLNIYLIEKSVLEKNSVGEPPTLFWAALCCYWLYFIGCEFLFDCLG